MVIMTWFVHFPTWLGEDVLINRRICLYLNTMTHNDGFLLLVSPGAPFANMVEL